jgi:hypothetical protein
MVIARICWPFPDNGSCRYPESRERVRAGVDFCSRSYWWTSLLNSMLSSLYWCWDSPWRSSQGSIVPAKARYYLFMAVSGRVAIHYRCFSPLSEAAWRWCRGRFPPKNRHCAAIWPTIGVRSGPIGGHGIAFGHQPGRAAKYKLSGIVWSEIDESQTVELFT